MLIQNTEIRSTYTAVLKRKGLRSARVSAPKDTADGPSGQHQSQLSNIVLRVRSSAHIRHKEIKQHIRTIPDYASTDVLGGLHAHVRFFNPLELWQGGVGAGTKIYTH